MLFLAANIRLLILLGSIILLFLERNIGDQNKLKLPVLQRTLRTKISALINPGFLLILLNFNFPNFDFALESASTLSEDKGSDENATYWAALARIIGYLLRHNCVTTLRVQVLVLARTSSASGLDTTFHYGLGGLHETRSLRTLSFSLRTLPDTSLIFFTSRLT
jgi:hypothetical protein